MSEPSKTGFSNLELTLIFLGALALLGAHVALTVTDSDAESLVRLVTIVAAVLGVGAHNGRQLSTIKRQTNGDLKAAVRIAVREELAATTPTTVVLDTRPGGTTTSSSPATGQ